MKEPEDKGTQGSGAPNEPPSSEPTDSLVPPPTGPADSTKPEPGEPMDPLASPAEQPAEPTYAATMLPPEEPPEESPSRMWWWIVGIAAVALVLGLVFGQGRHLGSLVRGAAELKGEERGKAKRASHGGLLRSGFRGWQVPLSYHPPMALSKAGLVRMQSGPCLW